jgi:DNA-directed RNA polymerase subunit E'/Rpb7
MTSPYVDRELRTLVELQPYQMNSNIYQNIKENLTNRVAGKCITEGYVCKIYQVTEYEDPEIIAENFNALAVYDVKYIARICNPVHGSIITVRITEINKAIIEAWNGPIQAIVEITKYNPNFFFINSYGDLCHKMKLDVDKKKGKVDDNDIKKGKVLNKDDCVKLLVTSKKYNMNDNSILVLGVIDNIASDVEIEEMKNESVSTRQDMFVDPTKVNKNIDDGTRDNKNKYQGDDTTDSEDTDSENDSETTNQSTDI